MKDRVHQSLEDSPPRVLVDSVSVLEELVEYKVVPVIQNVEDLLHALVRQKMERK